MVRSPKVLLVYPQFPPSYWGFRYALELVGKRASMPPPDRASFERAIRECVREVTSPAPSAAQQ